MKHELKVPTRWGIDSGSPDRPMAEGRRPMGRQGREPGGDRERQGHGGRGRAGRRHRGRRCCIARATWCRWATLIGYLEEAPRPDGAAQAGGGSPRRRRPRHGRRQQRTASAAAGRAAAPSPAAPSRRRSARQIASRSEPLRRPRRRRLGPRRPTTARMPNWCRRRAGRPRRSAPCTARRRGRRRSCP